MGALLSSRSCAENPAEAKLVSQTLEGGDHLANPRSKSRRRRLRMMTNQFAQGSYGDAIESKNRAETTSSTIAMISLSLNDRAPKIEIGEMVAA